MFACKHFITAWVLLANIRLSHGFIFDQPMDCVLSPWTDWAFVNDGDLYTRNRAILQHPLHGGKSCNGDMSDSKSLGMPSITQTATSVIDNFLRPHGENNGQRRVRGTSQQGQRIGEWRDLLILIDTSGSIGRAYFDKAKSFLATLLGKMCPEPDPFLTGTNQAALIKFSTNVSILFDFDDYQNTHDVQAAIIRTPYTPGITCTATAFDKTSKLFTKYHGARNQHGVKNEILILTDGQSNCGGDAIIASQNAQSNAAVYGLFIGDPLHRNQAEIESYVSGPLNKHLFSLANFRDLETLGQEIKKQMVANNMTCTPFNIPG